MRCGCSVCSTYMVQRENGLESGCVCPACFFTCSACMGTVQSPVSGDALRSLIESRERIVETNDDDLYFDDYDDGYMD